MDKLIPKQEIKYLLSEDVGRTIANWAVENGELDEFCFNDIGYGVISTYLGTWTSNTSTTDYDNGKIRVRQYITSRNETWFLEEKIKRKNWVLKSRLKVSTSINILEQFANLEEVQSYLFQYGFQPSSYFMHNGKPTFQKLTYFRKPLNVIYKNKTYRLTFDSNIRWLTGNNDLKSQHLRVDETNESIGIPLFPANTIIFEIKGTDVDDLINYLNSEFNITPCCLSKFQNCINLSEKLFC